MRRSATQYVYVSVFLFACALLLLPARAGAQAITGLVSGSVVDASGGSVPSATVTLLNEETSNQRQGQTTADGAFVFSGVFPGRYTIQVEANGFKRLERKNLNVTAYERLALGRMALEVGAASESVTVTAQGQTVQTQSQERSAVLTTDQVDSLVSLGRMYLGLLKVLPGVTDSGDSGAVPNVNGLRTQASALTTDGTPTMELGSTWSSTRSHLDSIGEVKVLTSNYSAEYGGTGGAIVQVVTKAGTSDFHGTGYWYHQHEQFNANSFFNNRNRVAKAKARQNIAGYTIGGPIYWPGKFNSGKSKLFFFWTQEYRIMPVPAASLNVATYTVPTDLEIAGDFSQTLELSGAQRKILDPLNNRAQFSGNVIPPSRINLNGQKLLSVFPEPNFLDRSTSKGNYNYTDLHPTNNSRNQWVLRTDYNATDKLRMYVRGLTEANKEFNLLYARLDPLVPGRNWIPKHDASVNTTYLISATMVNELLFGYHHHSQYRSTENLPGDLTPFTRKTLGLNLPQWYANNGYDVMPAVTFDAPSSLNVTWDGFFPRSSSDRVFVLTDGITIIRGTHTTKAGISVNQFFRQNTPSGSGYVAGQFNFSRDTSNPNDANYGYANALLGNFTSYTEASSYPNTKARSLAVEWYVQDNFRVGRKLTLDYGMRFSWFAPYYQANGQSSNFTRAAWDPNQAPVLYRPVKNASNARVAQDPLTQTLAPAVMIGAIVPGSGNQANGMTVQSDAGVPHGFMENQGVLFGPRVGFSYDVFGDGKMAIRSGAAIFYQVSQFVADQSIFVANPPIQYNPTAYYGSMTNYFQSAGVTFPSSVKGWDTQGEAPTVYSYSLGIQRDIGFNTLLDVAYVGNQSRHQSQRTALNTLPYGAKFLPQNQDPTKPGSPLPDNFYRPYPGLDAITVSSRDGTSNYNSLQTQINRRFARGLQLGFSWTWSKAMGYPDNGYWPTYVDRRFWLYDRISFDSTHMVITNWVWDVPGGSGLWNNIVSRAALDNWQFSGIASFVSGRSLSMSFATVDGADLTGGGDGQRIDVTGDPYLAKGARTFSQYFDSTAFGRPAKGTLGTMGRGLLSGPGVNNIDMALSKEFRVRERLRFSLRFEAYNTFNHTQFSGVDTSARFDINGKQVDAAFGQVTSARSPRVAQVSLRVSF